MTTTPFHRFVDLVQFDQAYRSLLTKKDAVQAKVSDSVLQKKREQQNLEDAQQALHNLIKKRDAIDLEMVALEQEHKKKENRLATVANPREYQSLQNELQTCVERLEVFEDQMVELWQSIEQAETELKDVKYNCEQRLQVLEQNERAAHEELVHVEREIARLAGERVSRTAGIPEELLGKYDSLRERIPNPAVEVVNQACSGCFSQVPTSIMASLRRHALLSCPSCYRLLYVL